MHVVEMSMFSLNLVIFRIIKIMNRTNKNLAQFQEVKYLKNQNFQKHFLIKVGLLFSQIFFMEFFFRKDWTNFQHRKMTLILKSSRRLFILVGLTMTWLSEKMLTFNICRRGLMPNLIKKSWTVSNQYASLLFYSDVRMSKDFSNMNEYRLVTLPPCLRALHESAEKLAFKR